MSDDIVEWLKGYASATGAVGMAEEANRLIDAAEEIARLRGLVSELEGDKKELYSYGLYWQMEALGGR